ETRHSVPRSCADDCCSTRTRRPSELNTRMPKNGFASEFNRPSRSWPESGSRAGVDAMRADIVMARAAAAHAAWHDREEVNVEDLRAAARLALPHRRRRNPFDAPGLDNDELDELLPPDTGDAPDPDTDPDGPGR